MLASCSRLPMAENTGRSAINPYGGAGLVKNSGNENPSGSQQDVKGQSRFVSDNRGTKYKLAILTLPVLIISFGVVAGRSVAADSQGLGIPETLLVTNVSGAESPTVIQAVKPAYPALAAAKNVYGIVEVDVQIDTVGRVRRALPVSGPSLLRPAARNAALRWRFDGVKSESDLRSARLTFIFRSISYAHKKGETDFTPPFQMSASWEGIAASLTQAHSALRRPTLYALM
ncbi:MAG: hypothetical protein JWM21_3287 [Acidobacteria bacterium]|nr:hypothetical protein [Acidobacteriota bacterium]